MRTFITYLLISLLSFGLLVNEASAKRLGGGRSFGVQRSHNSMFSPNKAAPNSTFNKRPANNANKWGGLLGGLLIGGLLTSLFMGHGVFSGLMTWLILGVLIFMIVNFFRRKAQPGFQTNQSSAFNQNNPFNNFRQAFNANSAGNSAPIYPADFAPEAFLRQAKVTFNRLQAAYDEKNLHDLKEFTAPEVFGEIKMQLDERSNEPNKTEVITLEAKLLDVTRQTNTWIASVHFTGSIKEDNEPINQLDEIWHFRQFSDSKDWVVGGIQQNDAQFN